MGPKVHPCQKWHGINCPWDQLSYNHFLHLNDFKCRQDTTIIACIMCDCTLLHYDRSQHRQCTYVEVCPPPGSCTGIWRFPARGSRCVSPQRNTRCCVVRTLAPHRSCRSEAAWFYSPSLPALYNINIHIQTWLTVQSCWLESMFLMDSLRY